jgi:hypothetical protein
MAQPHRLRHQFQFQQRLIVLLGPRQFVPTILAAATPDEAHADKRGAEQHRGRRNWHWGRCSRYVYGTDIASCTLYVGNEDVTKVIRGGQESNRRSSNMEDDVVGE